MRETFDFTIQGGALLGVTPDRAREAGVPAAEIGASIKAAALDEIRTMANTYRARLSSPSAGKIAEYQIKEQLARDPSNASAEELALIDREAQARGMDRAALLAAINAKAAAFRQVALLIGALEAESGAAITAIPDDAADVGVRVQDVLDAATRQAEAEFDAARAMLAQ